MMNTKEMHGKQISQIWWPDTIGETHRTLFATEDCRLEMSATHHGDHDEFWILCFQKVNGDFVETERHNPRFIETIEWV